VIKSTTSTAVQKFSGNSPIGASGQIGEIQLIFFIYTPFISNSPTGRTACWIFTLDGLNYVDSCKGVPFLAEVDFAAHLGSQIAKKN